MGAFSIFSNKKKRGSSYELPEPELNYYELLGRRMNRLKYVLLMGLIVFVIGGFTFYSDQLNLENFRYMLKFMSIDMDSEIADGAQIEFDASPGTRALMISGDLVICDSNGVQIFDKSGERFLRERDFMKDPMCAGSGHNLLVCDRGSYELNAYTVYARIYTHKAKYPIYDLCSSAGSGRYAILTAANGYRSGIEIYDPEFRKIFDYYFADRYISGIAISRDGESAAACTVNNTASGDYSGELYLFDVKDTKKFRTHELYGEIPWKVQFRADGCCLLLTNRALRLYGADGEERARVDFGGRAIKRFCLTDDVCVLAFQTEGLSGGTTAVFYDGSLTGLSESEYGGDVGRIDVIGKKAYVFSAGALYTVDTATGKTLAAEQTGGQYAGAVFDPDSGMTIFIYQGKAVFRSADPAPEERS